MDKKVSKKELIAQAIAACADSRGRIRPKAVVEAAKNKNSILHGEFEWDIKAAAEQYWINRARELIREVRFEFVHDTVTLVAPYYVADTSDDKSSYIPAARIRNKKTQARQTIIDELLRIRAATNRAKNLAAFFNLLDSFEELLKVVADIESMLASED